MSNFPEIPIEITAEQLLKTVQTGIYNFKLLNENPNWLGIKEGIYYSSSFTVKGTNILTKSLSEYFYILVSSASSNPTIFPYSRTITVIGACREDDKNIHSYKFTRTSIVDYTMEEIESGGSVDLSNYYTKQEIDNLIGDIENLLGGI